MYFWDLTNEQVLAFCGFIFYPVATLFKRMIKILFLRWVEPRERCHLIRHRNDFRAGNYGRSIDAQIYFLILILSFTGSHFIVHVKASLHLRPKLQLSNPFKTVRVDNVFVFALCLTATVSILHATQHLREGQPLDREIYKDLWYVFFIFCILTLPDRHICKNLRRNNWASAGLANGQFLWP